MELQSSARDQRASTVRFYRPELDALRLFAFLSVFLLHSYNSKLAIGRVLQDTGRFGVCLFFMLSAYLITELLIRERGRTGTVHLKSFYIRRILRIWPLYFLGLILGTILGLYVTAWHAEPGRLAASLLLAGNWYVLLGGWSANPLIFPLWSISVEEQFYLFVPAFAKAGGLNALKIVSWLAIAGAYVWLLWLGKSHLDVTQSYVWAMSPVQFQFFGAGALVACLLHGEVPKIRISLRFVMFIAGIAGWLVSARLGMSIHLKASATMFTMVYGYGFMLAGTVLIFLAFLGLPQESIPKLVTYLGGISYGLYVYHVAMLRLVEYAGRSIWHIRIVPIAGGFVALFLTCIVAALSYKFFESYFIHLKRRFTFVPSRPEPELATRNEQGLAA